MKRLFLPTALGLILNHAVFAAALPNPDIVVATDGSGDFKTIQSALAAIPKTNTERVVVFIRNGIYHEKLRVDSSFVTLRGESRTGAQIQFPQLSEEFSKTPDDIGRAVVNVNNKDADDFVLENLTVENTAGIIGPHAFAIYSMGDRGVVVNCNVWSHGADTVAFWLGARGNFADYLSGSGSDTMVFRSPDKSADAVSVDLNGGFIIACQAGVTTRMAELSLPPSSAGTNR